MLCKLKKTLKTAKGYGDKSNCSIITEPLFFFGMIVMGIIIVYLWLARFGNGLEKYTDIVSEFTSSDNSNKSAERNLVYALAIVGSMAITAYYFITARLGQLSSLRRVKSEDNKSIKILITAFVVASATSFVIYTQTNIFLLSFLILAIVSYVIDKEKAFDAVLLFTISLYAIAGIYRLYVLAGGNKSTDITTVILISAVISLLFFLIATKMNIYLMQKAFLLAQLFIPFTLLVFNASRYNVGDEIITLVMTKRITWLVWLIIIVFEYIAVRNLLRYWEKQTKVTDLISFGTLVSIMNFNNYSGTGQIVSSDIHHACENIIGFSQIVELGQKPFADYIPVSGMYSFVQGFYLWLFGKDYYAYYYVTENLFYLTITFIVIWLLRKHIRDEWVLFVCLLVPILRYNRIALIIPIFLVLALPRLIKNKNLWLKVWLLTSLINGLYYPVFGASVCLGFLPLAIYQFTSFIKNEFTEKRKAPGFWVGWIFTFIPILASIPLLLGTLKHMLAMGGQTVYADGISRFGQKVPDDFFSYIDSIGIRLILYYVFTFLLQAAVVWVSAILIFRIGGLVTKSGKVYIKDAEAATLSATFGIAILVAFTYTLIRLDIVNNIENFYSINIYSRSAGIIYCAVIMIIILASRYLKETGAMFYAIALAVFLVAVVSGESVFAFDSASKLEPYYTVGEDYILVDDNDIPKLGECFVQQGTYDGIVANYEEMAVLDKNKAYMAMDNFGHYYLSFVKGDSVMESYTVRGYGAAQETVDIIKKNGTNMFPVDSFIHYYLYYYLLTSGDYIWNSQYWMFCPNTEGASVEQVREMHKNLGLAVDGLSLGRTPGSWGSSMETLEDIFSHVSVDTEFVSEDDTSSTITFGESVLGEDADFIYLKFADVDNDYEYILFDNIEEEVQSDLTWFNKYLMKKDYNRGTVVTISWKDDAGDQYSLNCDMVKGELLIPLGSGRNWLLNSHDSVVITVTNGEEELTVPEIEDVELLKVREVE